MTREWPRILSDGMIQIKEQDYRSAKKKGGIVKPSDTAEMDYIPT